MISLVWPIAELGFRKGGRNTWGAKWKDMCGRHMGHFSCQCDKIHARSNLRRKDFSQFMVSGTSVHCGGEGMGVHLCRRWEPYHESCLGSREQARARSSYNLQGLILWATMCTAQSHISGIHRILNWHHHLSTVSSVLLACWGHSHSDHWIYICTTLRANSGHDLWIGSRNNLGIQQYCYSFLALMTLAADHCAFVPCKSFTKE